MFERGDLITPTLGGHLWFEKPALLYWLMIGSYAIFGVSEWSARLGPAVCGLLSIFALLWRSQAPISVNGGPVQFTGARLVTRVHCLFKIASFDVVVTMTITWVAFFIASEIVNNDKQRLRRLAGF